MAGTTARLGNRYPFLSDTADVPRDIQNLAEDLDKAATYGVGTLAARPVSAPGTPGVSGRFYYASDAGISIGDLYFDFSQGYRRAAVFDTDDKLYMSANRDTVLYRAGVGALRTDGELRAGKSVEANTGAATSVVVGYYSGAYGPGISFGPSRDTPLYRPTPGQLRIAGSLVVDGFVTPDSLGSGIRDGTKFLRDDGTWQTTTGAAPGGTAGGDLSGTYPSPQIAAGVIVNADINAAAAIAYSKLALTGSLVNADIAAAAAIAYSKLALTGAIVNGDISGAAAIGIAKLAGYPTDGAKFLAGDGTWKTPPSGSPSGAAGGDLTGSTYPNPTIAANTITTAKIADNQITTAKVADGQITSAKIADATIVNADIADGQISSSKITDGTIIFSDIADATITPAKLQYKYTFGFAVSFSVAAGGSTDVTVNAAYSSVPVYLGTLMMDTSSDVNYGQNLHLSIISVSAAQCTFRVHNTGGSAINGVRIGWFAVGS